MSDEADFWMTQCEKALIRAGNYRTALIVAERHISKSSGGGETALRARLQHVIDTGDAILDPGPQMKGQSG